MNLIKNFVLATASYGSSSNFTTINEALGNMSTYCRLAKCLTFIVRAQGQIRIHYIKEDGESSSTHFLFFNTTPCDFTVTP